jgi:hypothetical protein
MARLTREQIDAAVKRQKPGAVVVRTDNFAADARELGAAPDAVSRNLEQARQKYAKGADAMPRKRGDTATGHEEPSDADDDDDVIVYTRQKDAGADYDGPGSKAIVLDPKGNVLSEQG